MGSLEDIENLIEACINEDNFNINNGKLHNGIYKNNYITFEDETVVQLTQGKYMVCDTNDWNEQKQYYWSTDKGYAKTTLYDSNTGARNVLYFHQSIMSVNDTDHINRLRYDNRRINLRHIDDSAKQRSLQLRNTPVRSDSHSGEKHISFLRDTWRVRIYVGKKEISKTFSIIKYGDEAFQRAIQAIDELLKQYFPNE